MFDKLQLVASFASDSADTHDKLKFVEHLSLFKKNSSNLQDKLAVIQLLRRTVEMAKKHSGTDFRGEF